MRRFLKACLEHALHALSHLVPRDPRLWIFIGWRRTRARESFAENPKYQFLEVARNHREIRAIWIGQDAEICAVLKARGFEAYSLYSLSGIWLSLRAGYTFVGSLPQPENWRYMGRTKLIQLWHSKSLKKTGFMSPYGLSRYNRFLSPHLFASVHRFIAISHFLAPFITRDFRIPAERILITGIPKHDPLLRVVPGADIDADEKLATLIGEARERKPNRLILYGPTFRPDGADPLGDIDLARFDSFLRERNEICIIQLHPKFATRNWIPRDGALTNILFSQNDQDIYPVISGIDVLITDYSSLAFDFLLMNKPVFLYAFDMDSFKEGMGIYDELWDAMPGPKVFSFTELLSALSSDLGANAAIREEARKRIFTYFDGNAAHRIAVTLLKEGND